MVSSREESAECLLFNVIWGIFCFGVEEGNLCYEWEIFEELEK